MTARGSARRVRLPASIDATGTSDVSSGLQAFVDEVKDDSTIVFKAGGTYRLDTALILSGRRNLTLEGSGARLELRGTTGHFESIGIQVRDGSTGTTIRNFAMVGNDSEAGTSAACCSREAQHGIAVLSAANTLIEDMDIRRVWGDCVYVSRSATGGWSDGVTFRDSTCTLTGRHGVGLIAGKNVRIERNVFDQIGYMIVDIEPNDSSDGASDVLVADNTIGSYGLTDQYVAAVLSAGGPDTGAPVTNVTVTRNTVAGNRAGYDGAVLGAEHPLQGGPWPPLRLRHHRQRRPDGRQGPAHDLHRDRRRDRHRQQPAAHLGRAGHLPRLDGGDICALSGQPRHDPRDRVPLAAPGRRCRGLRTPPWTAAAPGRRAP